MHVQNLLFFCLLMVTITLHSQSDSMDQDTLPYHSIPEYPENYEAQNVISRVVDGLGYRYYWATEGLRKEDTDYRPTEEAASFEETLLHIHGLSVTVLNTAKNMENVRPAPEVEFNMEVIRRKTLENIAETSMIFRGINPQDLDSLQITFKRGEKSSSYPLWHLFNGPLMDAIYHTGQLVSFRRTSGNPMDPSVSVFSGKNRKPKN